MSDHLSLKGVAYNEIRAEESKLGVCMSFKLDELDASIIELLQRDSRMMYKDIAEKTNVSLPTVRARIKRLLDLGVIKKFTIVVDADKISGKDVFRIIPSNI